MKELISENVEYFTIAGIVIGVIGIILAIIFYQKGKRKKGLTYHIKSFNLIKEEISDLTGLEVFYKKNEIKNLTISKLALWNSGNQTINDADIVKLEKLQIKPSSKIEILDAEIVSQVDTSNNFTLKTNDKGIEIQFDYIDSNQGCAIKVYHTGKSSMDIKVIGKIKGAGKIKNTEIVGGTRIEYKLSQSKRNTPVTILLVATAKIGWIIYLIMTIISIGAAFYENNFNILWLSAFFIFGMIVLMPKGKIPRSLQKIYSDER